MTKRSQLSQGGELGKGPGGALGGSGGGLGGGVVGGGTDGDGGGEDGGGAGGGEGGGGEGGGGIGPIPGGYGGGDGEGGGGEGGGGDGPVLVPPPHEQQMPRVSVTPSSATPGCGSTPTHLKLWHSSSSVMPSSSALLTVKNGHSQKPPPLSQPNQLAVDA